MNTEAGPLQGVRALPYHADLNDEYRARVHTQASLFTNPLPTFPPA